MNFLTQVQEVGSQLRLDVTQSTQKTLCQRWLNQTQKEIWEADNWWFSQERAVVQTIVDKTAGTVSVNSGAATVTGVSTSFTSVDVGAFIQFSTSNDWYKITAVASATSLTIETNYVASTNLSAGTYTLRQMFYSMPSDCERILDARQTITPDYIEPVYFRDFDIFRANPSTTGNPTMMLVYGLNSSNVMKVTLYPFPSAIENIEVRYKKNAVDLSADTDTSLIPTKWSDTVMVDGAIARGLTYLSTSDPKYLPVQQMVYSRYKLGLRDMLNERDPDQAYHPIIDNRDKRRNTYGPILPFKYGYE